VLYRFAGSANGAVVWVTFEIPSRGVKRLIARLFRLVAQRALRKAFEEDRRDLESGAYARYRARQVDVIAHRTAVRAAATGRAASYAATLRPAIESDPVRASLA
jgi:hypothetical protein